MSYFIEVDDYKTYSESDDTLHFSYNKNSGGGQAFLEGYLYDENGYLQPANILVGKNAFFKVKFEDENGEERSVIIDDAKAKYPIKPRGKDSPSVKFQIQGDEKLKRPSLVIPALMMLPCTCTVMNPNNLKVSILSTSNYWLHSMWLECSMVSETEDEISLIVKDCIFSGGASSKDAKAETKNKARYFKLNVEKRINDIISLSRITDIFSDEIAKCINFFAEVYLGLQKFNYEKCIKTTQKLMELLAQQFPNKYSGITDPLPILCEIAESRKDIVKYKTKYFDSFPRNRIIFGAPGTGKSHTLEDERKELLYKKRDADENEIDLSQYGSYERITFHPDYSYANFVGTYKPVPDEDNSKDITYKYVPGPFMRILVKALRSGRTQKPKPYLLIIEEINRANAAAVLGDLFQLLDRNEDNVSEYSIQTSEDMRKYLADELGGFPGNYEEIRIPDNMFIWATMNSADQGVYPMDTAFKRRWNFEYIDIDANEGKIKDSKFRFCTGWNKDKEAYNYDDKQKKISWNKLRKVINNVLATNFGLDEDKLLGPFFISKSNILDARNDDLFWKTFDNKVLMYLCDDALRHRGNYQDLFKPVNGHTHLSYAWVHKEFEEKGLGIFNFNDDVLKKISADENESQPDVSKNEE